ncbi:hypothetical protein H9Q10_11470 [Eikenella sp. S3360]|uniref:Uncharacterized protein n=1 Tax=Eikenella glucosivorans TaxID=2766967 RepID=A0ABS0NDD6_9NEIS|nr:hypothetical protein [Eikenella glucosivorans]MBH5330281.1 hypothetical protein [Eikenella glucosivorans]
MTEAEARTIICRENLAVSWFGSPRPGEMAIRRSALGKYQVYAADERAAPWGVVHEFDALEAALDKLIEKARL